MSELPNIIISKTDAKRLEDLMDTVTGENTPIADALEAEISRADIVESKDMPANVVTMNSTVKFKVLSSQETFCLTLVYPKDMKDNGETISILAPVGSALLGLKEGETIEWSKPGGGTLKVQIEEVVYQPEREGEFHR